MVVELSVIYSKPVVNECLTFYVFSAKYDARTVVKVLSVEIFSAESNWNTVFDNGIFMLEKWWYEVKSEFYDL